MNQSRRMLVLRAIIEDYIRSQEPIGSTSLIRNHDLGVSSATIRGDMAALEAEGYLVQPHTSAGRIPTEKGYRYFVDRLNTIAPLSAAQKNGIRSFLDGSASLQDTLQRAARLLASITGQIAVVTSPSLNKATVRHVEFVAMSANTILMIVITDTGRLAQRLIAVEELPAADRLHESAVMINAQCVSLTLQAAAAQLARMLESMGDTDERLFLQSVVHALRAIADEEHAGDVFTSGVSRFTQHNLSQELAPLFDALEEQVVLMRLMTSLNAPSPRNVSVAIGSETHTPGLMHASLVSTGYGHSDMPAYDSEPVAFIGSIGPTHMDYVTTISAVQTVARYLTDFLDPDSARRGPRDGQPDDTASEH